MVYVLATKEMLREEDVVLVNEIVNNTPKFHPLERDHNYYIKKGYRCPYCNLGSEPVPEVEYLEWLKSKEKPTKK